MNPFEGIQGRKGPQMTTEFRRIQALPERDWQTADDLEELRLGLTEMLRVPGGKMELRDTQAAALRDIHDFRGLFGPIAVGEGKSLITLLAPTLLAAERPVLMVPAALRDQTNQKVIPQMREHWRLPPKLCVLGYSELSLAKNAELLKQMRPDCIIADECHYLKNLKSGRTRRVSRYMRDNPMTVFIAVSGTVANQSIMDYWHLIQWALKPKNTPLPTQWYDAKTWAEALDERIDPKDRRAPGALKHFCSNGENVRQGYRRRLSSTPGVLATEVTKLGVSLRVIRKEGIHLPSDVRAAIQALYDTWETPGGEPVSEAVDLWRYARELVCGFYYRWDPAPPQEWLRARKAWKGHVRETLSRNRRGLDTELQVWNECERETPTLADFCEWRDVRKSFKPNTVAVWQNPYLVEDATHWLNEWEGICWVNHVALGNAISANSGHPYYAAGDSGILDASGPVIASISAHGTGKNLQTWNRNLVTCPPTSGDVWEQLLGRTHRQGQKADSVTYEVYQHSDLFKQALEQAVADAEYLQDSLGNRQRLLYCDRDIP